MRGNRQKRLTLYGAKLDKSDGLQLGVLERGKAHEVQLMMRIRGEEPPKQLEITEVRPDFLQVSIKDTEKPHLKLLVIRVPETAPDYVFDVDAPGVIVISTDLVPTGRLNLPVRGVVSVLSSKTK